MEKLAINGGDKVRKKLFPGFNSIDQQEISQVNQVLNTGILSKYIGGWHKQFYGGEVVKQFESAWMEQFNVKHALAVNSASSGLIAALGAIGVCPGDEVIVTPFSMCISATAPLFYGAIPIFADINQDDLCLDYESVKGKINSKTKAIIVVDLFGHPFDQRIKVLAEENDIYLIEDAAQAPGAMIENKFAGTFGDVGIFSLNYHKHIHSGEGGIVVTNSKELADRVALIRNHAEAVVEGMDYKNLTNMLGFNFRMTEIEAAIGKVQIGKLDKFVEARISNVNYIESELSNYEFLNFIKVKHGVKNVYYKHAMFYNENILGIDRDTFFEAVKSELMPMALREDEGVNISLGYVKPLYYLPIFQKQIAIGDKGYPFKSEYYNRVIDYNKMNCNTCDDMHHNTLITHEYIHPEMKRADLNDFINAIKKVADNYKELI